MALWVSTAGLLGGIACIEHKLRDAGRGDLASLHEPQSIMYVAAVLSSVTVGGALMASRPRHPVGWLFAALGLSIGLAGVAESYAFYGALARPGSLPAPWLAATYIDSAFIPWFMLLTLIVILTPTGNPSSMRWRWLAWVSVIASSLALGLRFISDEALVGRFAGLSNPIAPEQGAEALDAIRLVALMVANIILAIAVGGVFFRYRAARGLERQQMRWLVLAAVPMPPLVAATWVAAFTGHELVLAILAGALISMLPIGAGLAIARYHLYDVERLISRALTYSILSVVVVGSYAAVVIVLGNAATGLVGDSTVAAVIATLVAVSIAGPARRRIQALLDRRFNHRAFEASEMVRRYVRDPVAGTRIEEVLAEATGDPGLSVAYWIEDRGAWVAWDGGPVVPGAAAVEVTRRGLPVARITSDEALAGAQIVQAAISEAQAELESARLRAAVALQLVEVRESRARIVAAQIAERRKIERDLHDGAQQRLLALALQLRAAQVSGDPDRAQVAIDAAVEQIQVAVRELRELANGLHPSVLNDGGLAAAFEALAARTPVAVRVEATAERFPSTIESTAWFIACEAVTNAVKHGVPAHLAIRATREASSLVLTVRDDGIGGANPGGRGLRGIADRAEAAGGRLTIESRPGQGTLIRAELPCAS